MLMLASAARHGPWELPPWVQAEAIQQEARAEAMLGGDISGIEASLDEAGNLLTPAQSGTTGDGSRLAAHYTAPPPAIQLPIRYHAPPHPPPHSQLFPHTP